MWKLGALVVGLLAVVPALAAGEFRDRYQDSLEEEAETVTARVGKSYYYYPANCTSMPILQKPTLLEQKEYDARKPLRLTVTGLVGIDWSMLPGRPQRDSDRNDKFYKLELEDGTVGYLQTSLLSEAKSLHDSYSCLSPYSPAEMAAAKKKGSARAKVLASKPGVSIGMTAQQVREETNWGAPQRINRTTTAGGTREQWVYGGHNYIYFTNGVVTSIQH